jgi:hypothetical protein
VFIWGMRAKCICASRAGLSILLCISLVARLPGGHALSEARSTLQRPVTVAAAVPPARCMWTSRRKLSKRLQDIINGGDITHSTYPRPPMATK